MSPDSVCMQPTPSITLVFMVAMPRPISRSGKMPRPCVMTMVLEALRKPMATIAPTASHRGACPHSASVPRIVAIAEVPPKAIHLRVSSTRSSGPNTSMPHW